MKSTGLPQDARKQVLGITGNVMVALLYMSPLATMYTVVKTRDTSSIDVRLAIAQVGGFYDNMRHIFSVCLTCTTCVCTPP